MLIDTETEATTMKTWTYSTPSSSTKPLSSSRSNPAVFLVVTLTISSRSRISTPTPTRAVAHSSGFITRTIRSSIIGFKWRKAVLALLVWTLKQGRIQCTALNQSSSVLCRMPVSSRKSTILNNRWSTLRWSQRLIRSVTTNSQLCSSMVRLSSSWSKNAMLRKRLLLWNKSMDRSLST
jgi:hypothetical protein